jgi:hypothetical protein
MLRPGPARDGAARASAALAGVKHPGVLAVARQIHRSAAALVIAEPAAGVAPPAGAAADARFVSAIAIERLLPQRRDENARATPPPDTRFLAEELLASGVDSLQARTRPIVVFINPAPVPLAPAYDQMHGVVDRLALMGIDCAEWMLSRSVDPPALAELDPGHTRPVVYVPLNIKASSPQGATLMARLADTVGRLVERGERVLFSVAPSPLRAIGAPDPMVSFLEPLGLVADSGRPLLREMAAPNRRLVTDEMVITSPGADHPVSASIRGITTAFVWPIPITFDSAKAEAAHTKLAAVVSVPADPALWAESQWQDFYERRERAATIPAKDSPADLVGGPWTIAAALERPVASDTPGTGTGTGAGTTQRILVVGSFGWFFDPIAMATAGMVDGRLAPVAPGNLELFTAGVMWLAGLDDRIAPGPVAGGVPTIPPLDPGTLALIRWSLIAGVPVGVLALGVAWRMMKG